MLVGFHLRGFEPLLSRVVPVDANGTREEKIINLVPDLCWEI
jgi:hypothetical protein